MSARHPAAGWTWRVFATCWLVYTAFWTPYIVREHYPALALLERGSLNVERYLGFSDDIFRGPRGGAYINNNPGASLTAALALLPLRPLLMRVDQWNQNLPRIANPQGDGEVFRRMLREGRGYYFLLWAFLTVALVMAPATAGTAAYFCARLADAGVAPLPAARAALLVGLGTPLLFRAAHLNHNLLVCNAGFVALLLLWDPRNAPLRPVRAAGAGLLAGYCFLCDYSGAVVVAVTALYTWWRCAGEWKILAAYCAGVLPGVAGLAIYQAWAFGGSLLPSQHYMPHTAPTSRGYRGIDWPSPALLWANFFDPRFGLFAYCPALVLAFAAPFVRRVRYRIPSREITVLFTYFFLFVVFCAANQYSWLQPLTGFRYLVPVVPGLALLALQAAQGLPRLVRWGVAAAACGQSLVMVAGYQNAFPRAVETLWQRGFELPWMMRLGYTGVRITWVWPLATFILVVLAVVVVWTVPRRRVHPNPMENKVFFHSGAGPG